MAASPPVNYLNRDFDALRSDLINFAKTRHPDLFQYFNDASPDMLYLEMCAYIGDNNNYFIDKTFNENFRSTAQARESLLRIADSDGFFNFGPTASYTQAQFSITVPPIINNGVMIPDPNFLLTIDSGLIMVADNGTQFEVDQQINFADQTGQIIIPNYDTNGALLNFTVNKYINVSAGQTKIQRFYVSSSQSVPFLQITIDDTNILGITGVASLPGNSFIAPTNETFLYGPNNWYEVKFLAQSQMFVEIAPDEITDPVLQARQITSSVKQGQYVDIPNRFISRRDINGLVTLTFGNSQPDISNFKNLLSATNITTQTNVGDILTNTTLGNIPNPDSTIFIQYKVGGGIDSNSSIGQINTITSKTFLPPAGNPDQNTLQQVRNSLTVTNLIPAIGGRLDLTNDEIRNTSGATFAAKDRAVNYQDFAAIIANMPISFGSPYRIGFEEIAPRISVYSNLKNGLDYYLTGTNGVLNQTTTLGRQLAIQNLYSFLDQFTNGEATIPGFSANEPIAASVLTRKELNNAPTLWLGEKLRLYVVTINDLGQLVTITSDSNGVLQYPNQILKNNIQQYLLSKRLIGDWIDIVDGRVVNIKIVITVTLDKNNVNQVVSDCLTASQNYFNISNWQMNQPIFIDDFRTIIQQISGVINVVNVQFQNIFGTDPITNNFYQIPQTGRYRNNLPTPLNSTNNLFAMNNVNNCIISYPDTIFEVKYPDNDIVIQVL